MPSWKKVITSGSSAQFSNVTASGDMTAQKVGIGTTTPTHKLSIYAGSDNATGGIQLYNDDSGGITATDGTTLFQEQNTNHFYIRNYEDANVVIRTNDTTALTLDNSQNATFAGTITSGIINGLYINAGGIGDADSGGTQRIGGEGRTHLGGYIKSYGGNATGKLEVYSGTSGAGTLALTIDSSQNATFAGDIYTDKIRRATDSGTTTKILLNDEVIKLYAGHSSNETLGLQQNIVSITGHVTASGNVSGSVTSTGSFGALTVGAADLPFDGIAYFKQGDADASATVTGATITIEDDGNNWICFNSDTDGSSGLISNTSGGTRRGSLTYEHSANYWATRINTTDNVVKTSLTAQEYTVANYKISGSSTSTGSFGRLEGDGAGITGMTDTAALPKAGGAMTGPITTNSTFDGVDVATRDGVLTSTTTTANAALPKAGGAMTGAITTNSTFDGVDIATRDGVLTSTTTTANAALPKAGGAMTGAITTNSTFDGVDIATRDGVLTSTTTTANSAVQPADTFYIGTTSIAHNRGSAAQTLAGVTVAKVTVTDDSSTNTDFAIPYHNGSDALLDDTGVFTYNPSTQKLIVPNIDISGTQTFINTATLVVTSSVTFEGSTSDGYETSLGVTNPTADRTITLPNADGNVVLDTLSQTLTNKTLVAPVLGTPASGTATNITGLPIVGGTTGTLSVARGGTGVTTSTGTGNVVLSAAPTLTGHLGTGTIGTTSMWVTNLYDGSSAANASIVFGGGSKFIKFYTDGQTSGDLTLTLDSSHNATFGGDVSVAKDGGYLKFGADGEVTLQHLHNAGLLLDTSKGLFFRDHGGEYIYSAADGDLRIHSGGNIHLGGNVGIGTTSPDTLLDLEGTSAAITLKETAASTTGGVINLVNTRAGGNGADGDDGGVINFKVPNASGTEKTFVSIRGEARETTAGGEAGSFLIGVMHDDGTPILDEMFGIRAGSEVGSGGQISFNNEANDMDFAVATLGAYNSFFVQGSDGKVGIGTSSPIDALHVRNGSILIENDTDTVGHQAILYFKTDSQDTAARRKGAIIFQRTNAYGAGDMYFCADGTGDAGDASTADARLFISGSGNVGIGTTTPNRTLSVSTNLAKTSTTTAYPFSISSNESSGMAQLSIHAVGGASAAVRYWNFQTEESGVANAGNIVFQQHGGNVGIGVTDPDEKLEVVGDIKTSVDIHAGEKVYVGTNLRVGGGNATDPAITTSGDTNTGIYFGTNKVGIGGSVGLEVENSITVGGTVDGVDIATRDAVLTSTTTTAGAALPKAGGAMTGAITTNSTFDGVDIATRDGVLTSTTTTANAALPKAGGAMTGAITTNSTFDGVDIATRDGVLTSTTSTANSAVQPADTFYIGTTSIAHNRGSGALTLAGITLTTPTIASFTNATHDHADAAGGGVIALGTATSGNYVATITGGTGITSTAATSGEGTTHSLSVDAAQTQITSLGTITTFRSTGIDDNADQLVLTLGSDESATFGGHVLPAADNSKDLGSASYRFANLYTGDLHLSNEGKEGNDIDGTTGNWSIQEGQDDLYLLNNKTGKKYKFKLEEL